MDPANTHARGRGRGNNNATSGARGRGRGGGPQFHVNNRGRGGGHQPHANGRGRGAGFPDNANRGRGGGFAPPERTVDEKEAKKFISAQLNQNYPLEDSNRLSDKLFGPFGRGAMAYALRNSRQYEGILVRLFSQPLFTDSGTTLMMQGGGGGSISEGDFSASTHLLASYIREVGPFSRDRLSYVCFRGSPMDVVRYARTFKGVRTRLGLTDFDALDEEGLEILSKFAESVKAAIPQVISSSDPEADTLLNEMNLIDVFVKEQTTKLLNRAADEQRSGDQRRQAHRNAAPRDDEEDDTAYEQGYESGLQDTRFVPSFRVAAVEPTFAELLRDPEGEEAKQDNEKARRITYGSPIESFDHHLDTVFHTTRYDALQPLREGISMLLGNDFKIPKRRDGAQPLPVKVLFDLRLTYLSSSRDHGAVYVFHSPTLLATAKKNQNFGKRRLLPGSLVVLTHDKLITGEVCTVVRLAEFPPEDGFICLRLADTNRVHDVNGNTTATLGPVKNIYATYTILESSVYWETHTHSLHALQKLQDGANDNGLNANCLFRSLRCLPPVAEGAANAGGQFLQKPLMAFDRSAIEKFTFDESQHMAFEHIFSHPAPIVQGPPGTGKSYIGVTALRTMLREGAHCEHHARSYAAVHNNDNNNNQPNIVGDEDDFEQRIRRNDRATAPILVVCYTNHALDAFLTDLIDAEPLLFSNSNLKNLIRLGYRSKSERLSQHVLGNDSKGLWHFTGARKALHGLWDDAMSDNFIPMFGQVGAPDNSRTLAAATADAGVEDVGVRVVAEFLKKRKEKLTEAANDAAQRLEEAEAELTSAQRAKDSIRRDAEFVSNALDSLASVGRQATQAEKDVASRARKASTIDEVWRVLSGQSNVSVESRNALEILRLNDEKGMAHMSEFSEMLFSTHDARKKTMSKREEECFKVIKGLRIALDNAQKATASFFVSWRDERGAPPVASQTTNVVADETDNDESDNIGDLGDENEELFMEQPIARGNNDVDVDVASAAKRLAQQHQQHIRQAAVERPAFLDGTNPTALASKLNKLSAADRYALHAYLKDCRLRSFHRKLAAAMAECNDATKRCQSIANDQHRQGIQKALVVGATTTGLARYLPLLTSIGVRCVIVEEAAEISECHALAAILPTVSHFVQIGDHQQLRPKVSCYNSTKKNLHISLMERMLRRNNPCRTLSIQRRMRPEIADFIRPLYERRLAEAGLRLEDHRRVKDEYPDLPSASYGLSDDGGFVLYVRHSFPEARAESTFSWQNLKEAQAAVDITWYLTKQNPSATITILVPYTGMLQATQRYAKDKKNGRLSIFDGRHKSESGEPRRNVRIVSIDDFQGEESDVIILCLTRSTGPGFLRENNRICVALSRARHLQIVLGNFACFEKFKKSYWPSVLSRAASLPNGVANSTVALHCTTHDQRRMMNLNNGLSGDIVSALGGCTTMCGLKRECGHTCTAVCHGAIECQKVSKCNAPCARRGTECGVDGRTCDHPCPLRCFNECTKCDTPVESRCICGTDVIIPCHRHDPIGATPHPECTKRWTVKLPCGHTKSVGCYDSNLPSARICKAVCGKPHDDCGHLCKLQCCDCTATQSHAACQNACGRPLPCGHACDSPCSNICPPCDKPCPSRCEHHPKRCGGAAGDHHRCGDAKKCIDCKEKCGNACKHSKCTRLCFEQCDRELCNEQCDKTLQCGHRCRGLCGEVCLSRCVECDPLGDDDVFLGGELEDGAIFVQLACGHLFEVGDMDQFVKLETDFSEKAISSPSCPRCKALISVGAGVMRYKAQLQSVRSDVRQLQKRAEENAINLAEELSTAANRISRFNEIVENNSKRRELERGIPALYEALRRTIAADLRIEKQNAALKERFDEEAKLGKAKKNKKTTSNKHINLQISMSLCHRIAMVTILLRATFDTATDPFLANRSNPIIDRELQKLQSLPTNAPKSDVEKIVRGAFLAALSAHGQTLPPGTQLDTLAIQVASARAPLGLTDQEKRDIMSALTSNGQIARSGAFRKCQCGEMYAIGDCGGAMETATCPGCGSQIGGTQHRDVGGVRHTGEIDGSNAPAWPQ